MNITLKLTDRQYGEISRALPVLGRKTVEAALQANVREQVDAAKSILRQLAMERRMKLRKV